MDYLVEHLKPILDIDVATFRVLLAHFASFPIGLWFRNYQPLAKSSLSRENVSSIIGVVLVIIAYQWDAVQLFTQWILAYLLFISLPTSQLGKYTFFVTFIHVLLNHAYNFIYFYGEQTAVDYTGTLMMGTMKLSSLAFAVEDSAKNRDKLTDLQKKYVVREDISIWQHFNYTFSFVGILFGPIVFYKDHRHFMDNKSRADNSNVMLAIETLVGGLFAVVIYILCLPDYDVKRNYAPDVLASGLLYKHYILYISMLGAKCKYYFVWLTAQSACLCAGLGREDPSITATVNPLRIELATSLKQFVDNWNIFAGKWLRFSVFERVPRQKELCTFVVSAIWHGFYPGYLVMFLPLAFYSLLGKKLHKVLRPQFQGTQSMKVLYAVITWVGTTILVIFNGTGFQLLHYDKISQVQFGLYCYPHVIALLLYICVPSPPRVRKNGSESKTNGVHLAHKEHIG